MESMQLVSKRQEKNKNKKGNLKTFHNCSRFQCSPPFAAHLEEAEVSGTLWGLFQGNYVTLA